METFSQQLGRVRKERGITQEQLAKEMNVSRQTISHWENGRAMPDIDTIKRLSQVLDFNFFAVESQPDAAQPDETQPAEAQPPKHGRGAFILAIAGVLLMAVMLAAVISTTLRPAAPEIYSQTWYMQTQRQPEAGKGFLDIIPEENPVRLTEFEEFEGGTGWFYHFSIVPRGDIAFTIGEVVLTTFNANGSRGVMVYPAADIQGFMGTNVVDVENPMEWTGGFPKQDVVGVGMLVRGTDALGNEQEFSGYVSLSQELKQS